MPSLVPPKVTVIGTGEIGCGWAALCVSRGWQVSIFDTETVALLRARESIIERTQILVSIGHADAVVTESGLERLQLARSLLQAVTEADWILESTPEDLVSKQRALEHVEQVCRLKAVITSSSSGLFASSLAGRLRRPDRMLACHPLNPVELIPVVEVIPGPNTDPDCTEDVRFWLTGLGRVPVVLRKEIPGGVVGRVQAAVWRECIQLVLEGAMDVVDVDIAMEMGPSLGWVAAGPHLTSHLGAGEQGVGMFIANLLSTYEHWWENLATWSKLSTEDQSRLVKAIEKAYGGQLPRLRAARDTRLARLLNVLSDGRRTGAGIGKREEGRGKRVTPLPSPLSPLPSPLYPFTTPHNSQPFSTTITTVTLQAIPRRTGPLANRPIFLPVAGEQDEGDHREGQLQAQDDLAQDQQGAGAALAVDGRSPATAGMMARSRVMSRRSQAGSRRSRNPSMTIWPARVPVMVLFWPDASRANAKSVPAAAVPSSGLSSWWASLMSATDWLPAGMKGGRRQDQDGRVDEERQHQGDGGVEDAIVDGLVPGSVVVAHGAGLHDGGMQVEIVGHDGGAQDPDGDVEHGRVPDDLHDWAPGPGPSRPRRAGP